MIFGVAKAISRENSTMRDADALIIDLSDVPMLGITACLAIENTVKDAVDRGLQVFIVTARGKVKQRLERFNLSQILPPNHLLANRTEALQQGLFL